MKSFPLQPVLRPSRCPACGRTVRATDEFRIHGKTFHRSCATYRPVAERKAVA